MLNRWQHLEEASMLRPVPALHWLAIQTRPPHVGFTRKPSKPRVSTYSSSTMALNSPTRWITIDMWSILTKILASHISSLRHWRQKTAAGIRVSMETIHVKQSFISKWTVCEHAMYNNSLHCYIPGVRRWRLSSFLLCSGLRRKNELKSRIGRTMHLLVLFAPSMFCLLKQ